MKYTTIGIYLYFFQICFSVNHLSLENKTEEDYTFNIYLQVF